jgi:ketosteroid isomerase-like protein
MRIGVTAFLLAFLVALLSSAQEPVGPVVKERTDDLMRADDPLSIQAHSEIQALIYRMVDCWNAHDLEGYMDGAWKSKDFLLVVDALEIRGWAEAMAAYQRGYADRNMMGNLVCERVETQLISNDTGLVVTRWTLYLKGGKVLGTSTMVARRFTEGWKFISDHSTTLEP